MILKELKPRKALNKAFLKVKPNRTEIEGFKTNLITLLDRTNDTESEEFHKNLVSDFLKDTYYKQNHFINTKGRNDLVIHNGQNANSTVGVILEAKKPTNKSEMITTKKLNVKAFQELVLYYLRERITHKNLEVKHLVATNINEWFIFDATLFDRLFAQNKNLVKQFHDFEGGRLADTKTDFFYKQIAEPFIDSISAEIEFTYFNIQDYQKPLRNADKADDNSLIALFKLLSPEHLLKLPFTNDSNSLDKRFYSELLHIIGLTETKEGSKKLIERNKTGERNTGTILEDAIIQLDSLDKLSRLERPNQFGNTTQERLFNVALTLSITWINRILFLKLLEAQLITYHKGDKSYSFLNLDKIKNYDDLNSLFFQVLARKYDERNEDVKKIFEKVPYLNSSLFEPTDIEQVTLFISNLKDDKTIPVISSTVLKDQQGKKRTGNLSTLEYLFEFLNAYDFSSEGSEEIQEDNKTLINASVLGLIFEKINGYKDGSFFTPGFITMYMCRETIRKAVLQKFNEAKNWKCQDLNELYNKIDDTKEANEIVNSIKICDPAVGSGHFLVSALNEMIAVKNDLKILQDRDGKRLKEYQVEVVNDELIVTDEEGELFEYNPTNKESQRIQETLFHEKQTIIENCLFGVDINSNSVKICRLRLWIELLKNAYYKNATELETLPNIDINIKCGNSLVSRFAIDADLKQALKKSKWTIDSYRIAVDTYRKAKSKSQKREMERLIADIKSDFRSEISLNDPKAKKLRKLSGDLFTLTNQQQLFEMSKKEKAAWNKKVKDLTEETKKIEGEIEDIKANKIFENAFEWRFEFPEVLNDDGDFLGFDVVIGNPPYIRQEEVKDLSGYFQGKFKSFSGKSDIYVFFYENSINLLKPYGAINFITSGKFFEASYGKPLIEFLLNNTEIIEIINFNDLPVFEGATAYPLIYFAIKKSKDDYQFNYYSLNELPTFSLKEKLSSIELLSTSKSIFTQNDFKFVDNRISNIIEKVKIGTVPIKDFCGLPIVGVKTGFNEGFLTDLKDDKIVKPYVFGRDIKKYSPIKPTNKIIFPYNDDYSIVDIKDYPEISSYLENQKAKLSQRAIIKEGLVNKTKCWYEYQQINKTVDYNTEYIIYPNVSLGNNFTLTKGAIIDMTGFLIKSNSRYLLAILNSKLIAFLMNIWSISRRGGYLEYKVQYIEKIPIKNISEKEQRPFIDLVERILVERKNDNDTTDLENQIDQLVYQLYELTEEEIKIVEGK
ncbi:MAG: class I SAM-dependent DNA methyltransferase [Chitinophagaceae bacterium]|nr:class I SAM-dependent DNA methyltransferase [Chitinophagaceae bacterium]MCW5904148.1 class I SAM-dependent DNA methyltransferase [Chitinophagaceae bacterium]